MAESILWTGPTGSPRRYRVEVAAIDQAVAGGEGLVYRALDTERGVAVALKLLTVVSIADYGQLVERSIPFRTIAHPNLMSHVDVFVGTALTDDPTPHIDDFDVIYTVADWVDGQPLADAVGDADGERLLGYVAGLARGLHALHRHRADGVTRGLVHRDVKPSNVRVTPDGTAVVIDFGVARALDHGDLTQGVGTYRWRAPEVLSGSAPITSAVDAWGLGAVAYWSFTGQPPGLDGAAAAREQLIGTPRCRQFADPVGVAIHIAALLETDPARRPTDLDRWAGQLDAIAGGAPYRRTRVSHTAVRAAIAAVAVGLGVGVNAAGNAYALDWLTPTDVEVDPRVIVVGYDPRTDLGRSLNEIDRRATSYRDIATIVERGGARAVGFVDFDSAEFSDGGAGRSNVIGSPTLQALGVAPLLDTHPTASDGKIPVLTQYEVDPLASQLAGVGLPSRRRDDGVQRSVLALARVAGLEDGMFLTVPQQVVADYDAAATTVVPGLFLRLAELGTGQRLTSPTPSGVRLGDHVIPLEASELVVRWSDQLDEFDDAMVVPIYELQHGAIAEEAMNGAIVLMGTTDPASTSYVDTPVGRLPEVLVQANALNTVLTQNYQREDPSWLGPVSGAAAALAIVVIPSRRHWLPPLLAATIALGWLLAARAASAGGLRLDVLTVPIAGLATGALVAVHLRRRALADRRRLRAPAPDGPPVSLGDLGPALGTTANDHS